MTALSDLKIDMSSSNSILLDVSSYSADSLLQVLHESGFLNQRVSPSANSTLAELLNTTFLDSFLPGLVSTYGANKLVDLKVRTKYAPNTFFAVDQMGANITAELEFIVDNETAITLAVEQADAFISASLNNFTFNVKVISISIKSIQAIQSNIGDIPAEDLKVFFNVLFRIGIPFINAFLKGGFQVPQTFFDILIIDEASFFSKDGYLSIMFSPEFI
jgi:hypothetical protein